ncbi:MAG: hypothetical protein HC916_20465, partial [Coleofasciculaceae cyanobacterium SM2_1_6]|nr:hypothetical protein [Coleofasciculaceae cyanobacterium SM2_1_6]
STSSFITTQDIGSANTNPGGVAGSVTLDAATNILTGTINSSASGGATTANFIDIRAGGLYRSNTSVVGGPPCGGTSLCSVGPTNGTITIRHGGGLITPFVIGGTTDNGTLGTISSDAVVTGITVPVPPEVNIYGLTTIITTTPPPPVDPSLFLLLRNPEAPPTPAPVIVGTPPEPTPSPSPSPSPIPTPSPIPIPSPIPSPSPSPSPIPSPSTNS